jgi:hypothetical protein
VLGEGMRDVEPGSAGWRAWGELVLTLALDRVAGYYQLR